MKANLRFYTFKGRKLKYLLQQSGKSENALLLDNVVLFEQIGFLHVISLRMSIAFKENYRLI